jgi:hypothetical protein
MPEMEILDSQQHIRNPSTARKLSSAIRNPQSIIRILLWGVTALVVTLLALRFSMRLLGVRPDLPFPGFVYSVTAPIVQPFYRFFPVSDRFDYYAAEWASLLAAGCVLAAALLLYVTTLLLFSLMTGGASHKRATGDPRT